MNREYWFGKLENRLVNSNRIAIYGIGEHTNYLLNYLDEKNKNKIVGLIDNNEKNAGKHKYGYNIYKLDSIIKDIDTIVISSDVYQKIIYDRISYLKEKIKILKIYEDIPTLENVCGLMINEKYPVKKITIDEYDKWNEFVDSSPQGNIFNKTWWFEAVQTKFEIYVCEDKEGKILGGMILPISNNGDISMPPLTQTLGILLGRFENCRYTKKLTKETEIIENLVLSIPNNINYCVNFNWNYTNWLPFMWEGYNQYCRYTYVIENLQEIDLVKKNFRKNVNRFIKKAEENGLKVKFNLSMEEFYKIDKKTYDRQGIKPPYSLEFFLKFDRILKNKNAAKSFFIVDELERIVAIFYIVYDKSGAHSLISGVNDDDKSIGAVSLAEYKAIEFSSTVTNQYNFAGSCIKRIEEFLRGFGGTQKMYFNIWKNND